MVCLRNICVNTLHKGDNDDGDDDDDDNNNNKFTSVNIYRLNDPSMPYETSRYIP